MEESNSKWNNWQRINFQNIQATHTTQCQENKQPNQKAGKRPKQTFLQKKTYRWLTHTWKDAQHRSLLEKCKSKLQWDITLHQSEWPSSKCLQTNAGEKGMFLHCFWECKLIQPLWKMVWRFLKKVGTKLPYDPEIPLLGIYPEETKTEKDICIPLLVAALFTIAST